MNGTGTRAWKPTADCIWNSFRKSGRKHLFLTGSKGSGKTTMMDQLGAPLMPGLTSRAIPGQSVWLHENHTENAEQIGVFDPALRGTDKRMRPVHKGFECLGIPALQRCLTDESDWVPVDEIGYLETAVPDYCQAIFMLLEKKHVLAAIRKQEEPFLQQLLYREDAFVVDLDVPCP